MKIQRCLQQQGQDTHSAMMPDYNSVKPDSQRRSVAGCIPTQSAHRYT